MILQQFPQDRCVEDELCTRLIRQPSTKRQVNLEDVYPSSGVMIESPGRNTGFFYLLCQCNQIKQRKVSLLDALWQVSNGLCTPAHFAQMIGAHVHHARLRVLRQGPDMTVKAYRLPQHGI